ncbi:MAG: ABC transporter permease [Rikenella sp.]|nr:ABC transporter permease [Rikenella sp.]
MNIIFRNFRTTLRRFRVASTLNIVGLSVAFAAFILILMQVRYEHSFDRFHPEADRIFRVEIAADGMNIPIVSRPFPRAFGPLSPGVAAYTLIQPAFSDSYITVERNGTPVGFMEPVFQADTGFTQVFRPEIAEGSADALREAGKVLVPMSLARKFFGREHGVLGEKLSIGIDADTRDYRVGGVYRDFPSNSQLDNVVYVPFLDQEWTLNDWSSCNNFFYVRLLPGVDPEAVLREWRRIDLAEKMSWIQTSGSIGMTALPDIYFDSRSFMGDSLIKHGKRTTTDLLLAIAVLVIGIAAVNFVNFATSLTPMRIKSINTQKVLGSPVGVLRWALVAEAVGIAAIAFVLAVGWVFLLGRTSFSELLSGGISLAENVGLVGLSAATAVVVGLLAGLYPAFYTTSFPPALVLKKGSFGMSPSGRKLRTALIGFQFVVSLGLIVAAMFLQLQNRYLRHVDTGMDQERIAYMRLGGGVLGSRAFENRVRQSPLIEDVAYSRMPIGVGNLHSENFKEIRGKQIQFTCEDVSWNFPQLMGIEVVEGDGFHAGDTLKPLSTYLFNERAARDYGIGPQDRVLEWGSGADAALSEVRGIVRDFNYASLHSPIGPMALIVRGKWTGSGALPIAYFKIVGDPYEAVNHIRRAAAEIDPAYPVAVQFFDAAFDALYRKDQQLTLLITLFSLLAVVISLVGVFGLVVFETQYRRKEIGVRKVMGATVAEILAMFNRKFIAIVLVCFVVAAPLAWYGVREWLATFAYRTPIYWWVFAVALAVVLFITLLTVTIQSWRAATANPVGALKAE